MSAEIISRCESMIEIMASYKFQHSEIGLATTAKNTYQRFSDGLVREVYARKALNHTIRAFLIMLAEMVEAGDSTITPQEMAVFLLNFHEENFRRRQEEPLRGKMATAENV